MPYQVRPATLDDLPSLTALLEAYMQETFQRPWGGTPQKLAQDGFGAEFELVVAEAEPPTPIAFAAWGSHYDLHHCMKGGAIIDLFVDPAHRGRGVAAQLMIAIAAQVQQRGGEYLTGGAVDNPSAQRFYRRCAHSFSAVECYVSGRAFRQLAELSGQPLSDVVKNLPEVSWNYEP